MSTQTQSQYATLTHNKRLFVTAADFRLQLNWRQQFDPRAAAVYVTKEVCLLITVFFLPPMSTEATHVQLIRSCQRSHAVRHLFVRLRELGPLFAELSRYLCKSHVWILRSDCISSLVEEPYVAGDWCPGSVSVPQRSRFTFATPCPSSCSLLWHRLGSIYIKVTNKVNKQKIHQKLACLSADILACFNC